MQIACLPRLDLVGLLLVALLPVASRHTEVAAAPTLEIGVSEPTDAPTTTPARKYADYCRRDWGLVREGLPFSERRWFDASGRMMFVIDDSGHRRDFEYDGEGNVVREVERFASGSAFVNTFRYNAARREWIYSYTDNGKVYWREAYAYDAQGRPTMTRSLDPDSPDHVHHTSYQYEGEHLVLTRERWDRDRTQWQTRYSYDARGHLVEKEQVTVYAPGDAGQRLYLERYTYDAGDRLISKSYDGSSLRETTAYRYDEAGNMLASETRDKDGVVYWAERFRYDCW